MPKYENCKRILLSLSLQTSDAHVARRKSAKLTSLSNDIFELGSKKLISKDQINAILRSYALKVEREMVAQDAVDRANRFSKSINFMGLTLEESDIIDAELHRRMAKLKSVNDISTPEIDALKAQGYRELMVLRLKQMLDLADYFPRITHSNDIIKETYFHIRSASLVILVD